MCIFRSLRICVVAKPLIVPSKKCQIVSFRPIQLTLSHFAVHLLLENCLDVTVNFCSSTWGLSQQFSADIASYFVYCIAEEELFITAFLAFNPKEDASRFWNKFVPIRHKFFPLRQFYCMTNFRSRMPSLWRMKLQTLHFRRKVCFFVVLANSRCSGYFCPPYPFFSRSWWRSPFAKARRLPAL